jgi:hypothetical protein
MRYEQLDRRTSDEERVRFEEVKEYVALELGRVQKRMPEPWFDELVTSLARLRIRVQQPS